jgi:hypothetical protein
MPSLILLRRLFLMLKLKINWPVVVLILCMLSILVVGLVTGRAAVVKADSYTNTSTSKQVENFTSTSVDTSVLHDIDPFAEVDGDVKLG